VISTIVKKEQFNAITAGGGKTFSRTRSRFWKSRFLSGKHNAVGLLCGREYRLFLIKGIKITEEVFVITLGDEYKRLKQMVMFK
jgi:hypothetical protein